MTTRNQYAVDKLPLLGLLPKRDKKNKEQPGKIKRRTKSVEFDHTKLTPSDSEEETTTGKSEENLFEETAEEEKTTSESKVDESLNKWKRLIIKKREAKLAANSRVVWKDDNVITNEGVGSNDNLNTGEEERLRRRHSRTASRRRYSRTTRTRRHSRTTSRRQHSKSVRQRRSRTKWSNGPRRRTSQARKETESRGN